MPNPTLHLLDWTQPLLHTAVPHLAASWRGRGPLDLSDLLVVVPTSRAGRRLREALAAHAALLRQAVFPPRVVLPEQVLSDGLETKSTATQADMLVAWIEVLRSIRLADFDAVFPVEPPERGFSWAARLARQFIDLQGVLVENGLCMASVAQNAGAFPELRRWQQLAILERQYDESLADHGMLSRHAARIAAAANETPPEGIKRVAVVATPDPQPLVLQRLEALCRRIPIDVLVHGPSLDLFDGWGRPIAAAWTTRTLELPDFEDQVHPLADAAAQSATIVALARSHQAAGQRADGMLGLAVADHDLLAPLHHDLIRTGIPSYDPEGTPHRSGELFRLLELILTFVTEPEFETACALIRCPAILAWLAHECGPAFSPAALLQALDEVHATHLPRTVGEARDHARLHKPRAGKVSWTAVIEALDLLESLRAQASGPFPQGLQSALASVYQHRRLELSQTADAQSIEAGGAWSEAAHATAAAASRLGRLSSKDTWQLALQQFGDAVHFGEKPAGSLELQGWLELHWEDAPHLIVAGLNDGRVPSAVVGDAFLPEALRERLGLKTNDSRLARDAYLLHALVASRAKHGRTDLLLGRTSAAGDPLRPSRLLLLCADAELPARVNFLFNDTGPVAEDPTALAWRRAWRLEPPAPKALDVVSVTAFRDHLACPFRFFLKYQLGMGRVDSQKEELDALDFGNLCHHALEGLFHESAMRRCADPEKVRAFLIERFDRKARALYGMHVSVPMLVQLESARQRLAHAARVHAEGAVEGWSICAVEEGFSCQIGSITVRGRIDRIDRNEVTGRVRVLDYKTFDQPKTPLATHARKLRTPAPGESPPPNYACFTTPEGEELIWSDLQLPLYRRALAPTWGETIALGYFCLPKAATETVINLWEEFDASWQAAADRCADGVADAIARRSYWPPSERLSYSDDFARLFHEGAADSVAWSANPGIEP